MPIETHIHRSINLTTFDCYGNLSFDEIIDAMAKFYKEIGDAPGKRVFWDLHGVTIKALTSDQIKQITDLSINNEEVIRGGKTAILAPSKIDFDIARTFEAQTAGMQRNLRYIAQLMKPENGLQ